MKRHFEAFLLIALPFLGTVEAAPVRLDPPGTCPGGAGRARGKPGSYRGPGDTVPGLLSAPAASPDRPVIGSSPADRPRPGRMAIPALPSATLADLEELGPDRTTWQLWWLYNCDAYLDLRERLRTNAAASGSDAFFLGNGDKLDDWDRLKPTPGQVRESVAPALLHVLAVPGSPELHRQALLALARVGGADGQRGSSAYGLALETYLSRGNELLVETAAVALGVLGGQRSVQSLTALMGDTEDGRQLVKSTRVPLRVRASAAYGLGLIGSRTESNELRRELAEALIDILNAPRFATPDLKVAAMISLGATPLDWELDVSRLVSDPARVNRKHVLTRRTQIEFLLDYFDPAQQRAERTTRRWLVRAHAPTAIARLCSTGIGERTETLRDRAAAAFLSAVGLHSGEKQQVQQGALLALGQLGDSDDEPGSMDARIRVELTRRTEQGDLQSRRFALIALAQTAARPGGVGRPYAGLESTRLLLLEQLHAGRSQTKPWAALALGLMGNALQANGQPVHPEVLASLRKSCGDNRRPAEGGAHMLALGLLGDVASVGLLAEKLEFFKGSSEVRSDAALAMGLTREASAIDALRAVLDDATHNPALFESLSVGLALCGDKSLVPDLAEDLAETSGFGRRAPIARALGQIGDSRAIPVLVQVLTDETATHSVRALVAGALGSICDKDALPWTARLSAGVNYAAGTATLCGVGGVGGAGVLGYR